jgi:hypothetical protein
MIIERFQRENPFRMRILGSGVVFLAALAACLLALAPLRLGLVLFGIVVWFSCPGVVLGAVVYRQTPGRAMAIALNASIWGYGLSSVTLLLLWCAGIRGGALLLAPVLAGAVAWLIGLPLRHRLTSPLFTNADIVAVLLLLTLTLGIVGRPFAKVASPVEDGRAYRAYFTADFVWRMAVAAELSKGDFPPKNPFFRRDQLRYYWLAHLLPAAEYQSLRREGTIEQILLVNGVALGLGFVAFMYGFLRQWVDRAWAAAAGVVGGLIFTSFEGAERLFVLWREGASFDYIRTLNIDAVTRWIYESLPIDGLQRLLWYQPQHSTAYALGLSAILVLAQAGTPSVAVLAFCGILLGLCLLLSTFSAIMLTSMVAVLALIMIVRERAWTRLLTGTIAGAAPLVGAVLICLSLRYVDEGSGSLVTIGVNPMAFRNAPVAILLSFGPMLIAAIAGAFLARRRLLSSFLPIVVIIVLSFFFYFFVDLRGHQHVYVGWRAGDLLFVAFGALGGYALQELWSMKPNVRVVTAATVALLAALAAPTFAIDFYNTQDTTNRMPAAGFDWTLVLHQDELDALSWIRNYTPQNAIVQVEPYVRDSKTWAYVPAFAERRMSAGLPISMVPLDKYEAASAQVRSLYQETDAASAHARASRLGIDYLIVGVPEDQAYPHIREVLRSRVDLFREVFHRGDVSIFYVDR